jgi:hypothetical protein
MQAAARKTVVVVSFLAVPLVAVIAVASWLRPLGEMPAVNPVAVPVTMVGVATGELADGVPVYRLPSVTVTARRSVELAKMAEEDRAVR